MFEHLSNYTPHRIELEKERLSAVVIPLIKKEDGYHVLFEVRSGNLRRQPGEICFPGGRVEADETAKEGAIRETCEELLIAPSQVHIFGGLDYVVNNAKLRIEPFLGELLDYEGSFSTDEVAEVFTVPLSYFLNNEPEIYYNQLMNIPSKDFPYDDVPGGKNYPWSVGQYAVHFYRYKGHIIWGLTAKLIYNNLKLLRGEHA